ncbi:MAG: hypothetical protein LQ342_008143 [Letrouitia transgressa]|nr:MAG: hypothetical protein LQ342_008143 [Letrouitia transgressa]
MASSSSKRKDSLPKPELEQRSTSNPTTPLGSRTSLPYPSFSKAHSKEAVGSRENIANRLSYYTPDPTDLDERKEKDGEPENTITGVAAPPSPPLTTDPVPTDTRSTNSPSASKTRPHRTERKKTDLQKNAEDLKRKLGRRSSIVEEKKASSRSPSSRSRRAEREASREEQSTSSRRSKPSTPSKPKPKTVTVEGSESITGLGRSTSPPSSTLNPTDTPTESSVDSDATSIAPNQPTTQKPTPQLDDGSTVSDHSPETPTLPNSRKVPSRKETPAYTMSGQIPLRSVEESPMPPPPPPPPEVPFQMPRVDYLLNNGGLFNHVAKSLLLAEHPPNTVQPVPALTQAERFFGPFNRLLDDYVKVMSKSGSLAVATGYRSIARKLLDRLEAVFARDISSETCACVLCQSSPVQGVEDQRGVSWGEILEFVCGRRELPSWPAFVLDPSQAGLGISTTVDQQPMSKLDIDVPEEFREHYVRQSKKTKQTVDRWLESQPISPSSPPHDIDDETLTFAMLTRLDPDQRPTFSSLLGVASSRPPSRSPTPLISPHSSLLTDTGKAIQRLYRLPSSPRDPESALYLLMNLSMHNVLATLAAISDDEWEILISGRFDGFLRSGADDVAVTPPTPSPSRGPTAAAAASALNTTSRMATPFPPPAPARAPTPASAGAPVALDEETEIATLAEIEREIFLGMEALEDAFEALHGKAEMVRHALRERGAGLAMANQARKGGNSSGLLDARLGTPASGFGGDQEESEDDGFDAMSEIAPSDSASCVSRTKRRGPRRRTERRTPAPVEEEEEEGEGEAEEG